jgi:DNA-directed RNA polymerase specialized sigma24 family protein
MSNEDFSSDLPEEIPRTEYNQLEEEICKQWQQFQNEFLELIDPNTPEGIALYAFIKARLFQFRLGGLYDAAYILNETFIRAFNVIKRGEAIRIPAAWVRQTAYNSVRELSRNVRKVDSLDDERSRQLESCCVDDFNLGGELALIEFAFQHLSPEDQKILNLKVVHNLSWREIQRVFAQDGKTYTESALRQKKTRALKQLRRLYHQKNPVAF